MISNNEVEEQYHIVNGVIERRGEFPNKETLMNPSVYEVIRVMASVPLFLEEHLDRLDQSIALLGHAFRVDSNRLKSQIHHLIEINQTPEKNIKIIVNNFEAEAPNIFLFFIPSKYPSTLQYDNGVSSILFSAMRKNPNIKAVAKGQREMINTVLQETNAYEALLVNENGEITEGSRSNIFLVKEQRLYTAPAKDVLIGITRKRVIDLSHSFNIPLIEDPITVDDLPKCEGLFLTGTSPKILPISSVNQFKFNSSNHPIISKLQLAYDELINEYIKEYKSLEKG